LEKREEDFASFLKQFQKMLKRSEIFPSLLTMETKSKKGKDPWDALLVEVGRGLSLSESAHMKTLRFPRQKLEYLTKLFPAHVGVFSPLAYPTPMGDCKGQLVNIGDSHGNPIRELWFLVISGAVTVDAKPYELLRSMYYEHWSGELKSRPARFLQLYFDSLLAR
jgi:hypothetical protein